MLTISFQLTCLFSLSMDVIQDVNIDEIEFPLEEDEDEDTTVTEEMMID